MSSYQGVKKDHDGFIDLNANELYQNLDKKIIEILKSRVDEIYFNRYPDTFAKKVSSLYAQYLGVDISNILIGNGSDELIGLIFSLLITKNKKIVTFAKDFLMYDYYCAINQGELHKYSFDINKSFIVKDFIDYIAKIKPDFIILSNPNNPTGGVIKRVDILQIVKFFKDTVIVIDEAYAEFSNESIIDTINTYDNLIVTRTLSKAFGAASLRIGAMISSKKNIDFYKENKVPYTINSFSQIASETVLQNKSLFFDIITEIKSERDRMYDVIQGLSLKSTTIYKSGANFLYGESCQKDKLIELFTDNKINIRAFGDNSFRITVADKDINDKVLDILKKVG